MSDKIDIEKKLAYIRGLAELARIDGGLVNTFLRGLLTTAKDEDRQSIKWVLNNASNSQDAARTLSQEAVKLCNIIGEPK